MAVTMPVTFAYIVVLTWLIDVSMQELLLIVLWGDSRVRHHKGPNQMHLTEISGRVVCKWMRADGLMGTFSWRFETQEIHMVLPKFGRRFNIDKHH